MAKLPEEVDVYNSIHAIYRELERREERLIDYQLLVQFIETTLYDSKSKAAKEILSKIEKHYEL